MVDIVLRHLVGSTGSWFTRRFDGQLKSCCSMHAVISGCADAMLIRVSFQMLPAESHHSEHSALARGDFSGELAVVPLLVRICCRLFHLKNSNTKSVTKLKL
jgi:hypothetical protein